MYDKIEEYVKLILGLMLPVLIIAAVVCLIKIAKSFRKAKETGDYSNAISKTATFLCAVVGVLLWVLQPNIYRAVLTALGLPFVHVLLFLIVNNLSANYVKDSRAMLVVNVISYLAFLSFYVVMPGSKWLYTERYAIFGLVTEGASLTLCTEIAMRGFQLSLLVMIVQTIAMIVVKKEKKQKEIIESVVSSDEIDFIETDEEKPSGSESVQKEFEETVEDEIKEN